jgi:hypothetical protein
MCIAYHRALLLPGGMTMIGVPNRLSPFYQLIRVFRTVTGTWKLDVEIPFTAWELGRLAANAGFKEVQVFGTASLFKDLRVYSRGFISSIADLLPAKMVEGVRSIKAEKENKVPLSEPSGEYAARRCREELGRILEKKNSSLVPGITDSFSSGLLLTGFK